VVEHILKAHQTYIKGLTPTWLRAKGMGFLYRFIIFISWGLLKLFYRYKVYGLENFVNRAAIVAPNHTSYWDPPIAASSWPNEVHFLARQELFRPFLFGSLIRTLNAHPVHGNVADLSAFKMVLSVLKEEKQIVLFPEGERTDGELGEIKPGIGMLLMRSKAVIIPTYIDGAFEVWSRDQKFPKPFGKISCVFGTPISWESFAHLKKREAHEAIAKELSKSLLELKKWLKDGEDGIPP